MSSYSVKKWTVFVVGADGTVLRSLNGTVTKLDIKGIEQNFETDIRAGQLGSVPVEKGLKEFDVKMTLKGVAPDFRSAVLNSYGSVISLQLNSILELPNSQISEIVIVRGKVKTFPIGGSYKPQEERETTLELLGTVYKQLNDNKEVFNYDPDNYIWSVDGVDVLAADKKLLGLS